MFYDNFIRLCNKVNKSPSAVAEEMGFKRSVVTAWKNGRSPRTATLQKIATYFKCSVAELTADASSGETKKIPLLDSETLKFALAGDDGKLLTEEDMASIRAFALFAAQRRKGEN